ncbi:MAG: hypothetical protein AB8G77_12825 [Rhodothermales bacterium]
MVSWCVFDAWHADVSETIERLLSVFGNRLEIEWSFGKSVLLAHDRNLH